MSQNGQTPPEADPKGALADNVMHFGRVLRAAGLPVGPGKVIEAVRAVEAVGITNRQDFYWTLHAVFVNRRDQRDIFDQAFHVFWRNPRILERLMQVVSCRRPRPAGTSSRKNSPAASPRRFRRSASSRRKSPRSPKSNTTP